MALFQEKFNPLLILWGGLWGYEAFRPQTEKLMKTPEKMCFIFFYF